MEKLSQILWRERELLEKLLYRLEVEQLVMSTGRTRWLLESAREVEDVLHDVRATELLRAVAADEAAAELGLEPNPSLQNLVDASEEPWTTILADHRDAFLRITGEVTALAETNRELITAGIRSARETLLSMTSGAAQYGSDGSAVPGGVRTSIVDRSL